VGERWGMWVRDGNVGERREMWVKDRGCG